MEFTTHQQAIVDRIRADARGTIYRIEPATTGVFVEKQPQDSGRRALFEVTLEPTVDGSKALHWEFIGPVEDARSDG
ncbi:hypothetical protein [Halorhabdus sp. CUG00001]|uniref:hypothetical protein n=1 Tax=Halorhabdus sp. CUG00001 TaxID=2600297 RepID=UPI00131CF51C|nr:hypothetical protein [Halorhabdus sp. CUG00001]